MIEFNRGDYIGCKLDALAIEHVIDEQMEQKKL